MATPIAIQNILTRSDPRYNYRMTGRDLATTGATTALGIGTNERAMRQLEEQLALEYKKLDELAKARKNAIATELISSGYTVEDSENLSPTQQALKEITGYAFSEPSIDSQGNVIGSTRSPGSFSDTRVGGVSSRTPVSNAPVSYMPGHIQLGGPYRTASDLRAEAEERMRRRNAR